MQDWPLDLIAETQLQPTTLCRLFVITPRNGPAMRFTDLDADITVDGDLYVADHSFQASAVQSSIGGADQNMDLIVLFGSTADRLQFDAAMRHVYASATVKVYIASHGNPTAGKGILLAGHIGSITIPSRLYAKLSVVGGTGIMDRELTDVYQPTCRVDFGSVPCAKNLADYSAAFTITAVTDDMLFATGLSAADGTYNLGTVTWVTGDNAGYSQELAYSLATGAVGLFYPPPYPMVIGDTGTIAQGCAKTLAACAVYYGVPKPAAFRGEPFVPGDDYKQVV